MQWSAYNQLIAEGYLVTRQARAPSSPKGSALPRRRRPRRPPGCDTSGHSRNACSISPRFPPTQPFRVADFRYGDLSGTDLPVAAWRRALDITEASALAVADGFTATFLVAAGMTLLALMLTFVRRAEARR